MAKKSDRMIDHSRYGVLKLRGKDGTVVSSRGNGDAVHRAIALHTIVNGKDIESVVRANKLDLHPANKYTNIGQFRMAVGAALRAKVNKGDPVDIGGATVRKLDQRDPVIPKVEAKAAPAKKAAKPRSRKAKKAAAQPAAAAA